VREGEDDHCDLQSHPCCYSFSIDDEGECKRGRIRPPSSDMQTIQITIQHQLQSQRRNSAYAHF